MTTLAWSSVFDCPGPKWTLMEHRTRGAFLPGSAGGFIPLLDPGRGEVNHRLSPQRDRCRVLPTELRDDGEAASHQERGAGGQQDRHSHSTTAAATEPQCSAVPQERQTSNHTSQVNRVEVMTRATTATCRRSQTVNTAATNAATGATSKPT